ncbi:hypothetical protein Q7A_2726 [Methylophaga nitratireducenticrescens]|nr:DUF3240 family protein [Methylophaga nitratireducenticrescens]AFI85512.2 hypothetical protein Q7A_2726 [Methylophaga nitratireducenticrescens]
MNTSTHGQTTEEICILMLNIAPELEEDLVDYLLSIEQIVGFSSYTVYGHGQQQGLSVAEQVSGRRKRSQYELLVSAPTIPIILSGLAEAVGRGIVYWQQPVSNFGRIEY